MFVETITSPRDEWELWKERLGVLDDPPVGLLASIAWAANDGSVTQVNLWESPDAISDFYVRRVHAIVQALGEPENKPTRHGEPLAVFIRR